MVFRDQSLDTEKWSLLLGQLPFLLNTNITVSTYVWKYEEEAGHYRSLSAWVFGASDYLSWHISYCKERVLVSCWCWPVAKLCPTLCSPMNCSTLVFPVFHCLLKFAQILVYWLTDAIHPSHPLPLSSPFVFNLSQHQGLFQWVRSSYQVAKVVELKLQHQSFQWIFRVDFPLGLAGLQEVLWSKELSRVFSSTTIWKHQFLGAQPSSWSNSHIHTWLLEKP